ncbi:MAG: thioredoxin fold domain-containing protein [Candidatus Hydrogenedentes bacterium]|nr:thioredoxin fold domain-containing protein [Candidatus Hydrogenedentota bacterium]
MSNDESAVMAKSSKGLAVKLGIVVLLLIAVGLTIYMKENGAPANVGMAASGEPSPADPSLQADLESPAPASSPAQGIPRLVDLGATKCIPCKMMAPILEQLKKDYAGRLDVQFIDVWENPSAGDEYGVQMIPTQIFYDASGKELIRHQGFISREDILAQWAELGVDLGPSAAAPAEFSRLDPAAPDTRPRESVCYMCDGDINPKTRTVLKTDKGDVAFCSPHCYFITYSSMVENKPVLENVSITDWAAGAVLSAASAKYVYGVDAKNRPTVKAFADPAAASAEQQATGGNIVEWAALQDKELATRCGFCDRAVYPEDACVVKVEGLSTWGCCTMCALGVAARLQKDIEVTAKDALTGETINVKTFEGHVALLEPHTSVAWAGTKKDAEGKLVSTGCFKQAFFVNEANLKLWVDAHPTATGRLVSIEQALSEKMKLTPQQISKACKIGECTPK